MADKLPPLPPGFTLDAVPPPPPGFTIDRPTTPSGPPTPPSAPSLLDRILKESPALQSTANVAKGMTDVVTGIPAFLHSLGSLPSNVTSDVKSLINEPGAAKRIGQETLQGILGLLPYQETGRAVLSGTMPSQATVERETGQLAGSMLVPKVGGGLAKRGARTAVKELPGAGVELQQIASEKAGALARSLEPGTQAVKAAYDKVALVGSNPNLDIAPLRSAAGNVRHHELSATSPNMALAKQAKNIVESGELGWTMDQALSEYRRMGEQIREIKRTRGEVPREMTDLYQTLRNVIENPNELAVVQAAKPATPASTILGPNGQPAIPAQPAQPAVTKTKPPTAKTQAGAEAWTEAQKLAHRQFSVEELLDRVNKAAGVSGEGYTSYRPNAIIKWIEQQEKAATLGHPENAARRFVSGFQPGELAIVKSKLRDMSRDMAALPSLRGAPVGSSQRVLLAALGEGLGQTTGHMGVGAAWGVIGGEIISRLMTTDAGRALVRRAMQIDPSVGPKFWATVAPGMQYGASQRQGGSP